MIKNIKNKTFRLFVSSTFEDFINERNLLQKEVFPYIENYCLKNGFQFQAIDLRWGVTEEAQIDHQTMQICINEVNLCKNHPQPNFLIMLGNRYGWIPVPNIIEKEEFESILNNATQKEKKYLIKWFKLDENHIPSSYFLIQRRKKYINSEIWLKEENIIRDILQKLVTKTNLDSNLKEKYFLSATEQEAIHGIFNNIDIDISIKIDNVFAYYKNFNEDEEDERLSSLKNKINNYLNEDNIFYSSTNQYFVSNIKHYLKNSIKKHIELIGEIDNNEKEIFEHEIFKNSRIEVFHGRSKEIKILKEYIYSYNNEPFIVSGCSGIGKSSFLAKIINEIKNKKIVYRFIGATDNSTNLRELLISICNELNIEIQFDQDEKIFFKQVNNIFKEIKTNVVIILDALDQLVEKKQISWLPKVLPNNLKIIISVLNDIKYGNENFYFSELSNSVDFNNIMILEPLKNTLNIKKIITNYLENDSRKVTNEQMNYIISKYNKVKTPLYLKIIIETVKNWKSHSEIKSLFLEESIQEQIKLYRKDLTEKYHHPKIIVEKVFEYINTSKDGLSEHEIIDIIRKDYEIKEKLDSKYFEYIDNKLPIIYWIRLTYQISSFLKIINIDGFTYLKFFHREFNFPTINYYHENLALYFSKSVKKYDVIRNVFHLDKLDRLSDVKKILSLEYKFISFISNHDIDFTKKILDNIDENNDLLNSINFYLYNKNMDIDIKNMLKYLRLVLHQYFIHNNDVNITYKLVRSMIHLAKEIYTEQSLFIKLLYEYSHLLVNIIDKQKEIAYSQKCIECAFYFTSYYLEEFCPACNSTNMSSELIEIENIITDIRHIPDEAFLNIDSINSINIEERNFEFKNLNLLEKDNLNDYNKKDVSLNELIYKQDKSLQEEQKYKEIESLIKLKFSEIQKN